MNQNFRVIEPVGFFKGVAREALRGRWGLAFGTGFLFVLLTQLPNVIFDKFFGIELDNSSIYELSGVGISFDTNLYQPYMNYASFAPSPISGIYTLLTTGAFSLGLAIFVIHLVRRAEASPGMIFSGFGNYFKSLGIMILISLMILGVIIIGAILIFSLSMLGVFGIFLSLLVLVLIIVAMIMIMLMYSLPYYILADNPRSGVIECLRQSRLMMKNNKNKLFILYLSFIGWILLYFLFALSLAYVMNLFMETFVSSVISSILAGLGYGLLVMYISTSEAAFYEKVSGISSGIFNLSENIPEDDISLSDDTD